jgi:Uma2 family endonuclease
MAMPASVRAKLWTPAEVRALQWNRPPETLGKSWPRFELIDGELIVTNSPKPPHQFVLRALFLVLYPYVREHRLGELLWPPADIEMDGSSLVQPDLFLVPKERPFASWEEVTELSLVIEASSPSTARYDRRVKRRWYQRRRTLEFWIVDLPARLIERWRPDDERPEIADEVLRFQPRPDLPPLDIDVPALFADRP